MAKIRPVAKGQRHNYMQAVFFVLLICFSTYVLLQSPLFNVRNIQVVGRSEISQQELVKLSGIVLGTNIFKLDLKTGQEKISLLPAVKEVELTRKFPSTIIISITERQPVAFLPLNKSFIEIDNEGIYLRQGEINKKDIPIITGFTIDEVKPGQKVSDEKVDIALMVIDQLPEKLVSQLSEIHIDQHNKIIIYTINGIQGRLGLPTEIAQKGDMFVQVLNQLDNGHMIDYIDITSFKTPVVKYYSTSEGIAS
ncbi:FtsQ-type POTRA domain-containing protein [Peptococcaceae bacterium 1198_IL3148]